MASLYQRFSGKINTNTTFPNPPEASRLLVGQNAEDECVVKTPRPGQEDLRARFQYQYRTQCEDEDVRKPEFTPPFLPPVSPAQS